MSIELLTSIGDYISFNTDDSDDFPSTGPALEKPRDVSALFSDGDVDEGSQAYNSTTNRATTIDSEDSDLEMIIPRKARVKTQVCTCHHKKCLCMLICLQTARERQFNAEVCLVPARKHF